MGRFFNVKGFTEVNRRRHQNIGACRRVSSGGFNVNAARCEEHHRRIHGPHERDRFLNGFQSKVIELQHVAPGLGKLQCLFRRIGFDRNLLFRLFRSGALQCRRHIVDKHSVR